MLQTNMAHEPHFAAKPLNVPAAIHLRGQTAHADRRAPSEAAVDETLAESFPASDPPAWNSGVARLVPAPVRTPQPAADREMPQRADEGARAVPGVIDVSRPAGSGWTPMKALASIAGAGGIVLLLPFAVLLIGLPVVLAVRALLEILYRLFPGIA